MQFPGGRKLNDDTSAPQEWHMANAIDPPMVRKSDSRPLLVNMFMTTIVVWLVLVVVVEDHRQMGEAYH